MRNSILVLAMLASPASAEGACQIAASAVTTNFKKVPIHAFPTSSSEVLDIAPTYQDGGDGAVLGARFTITEIQKGWVRATGVSDWSGTVQVSDGWINALNVRLSPQTYRGYDVASAASKVVWEGTDWPKADILLDCKGEWGKVRLRGPATPEPVTAWVRGFCSDQAAPCDEITSDGDS